MSELTIAASGVRAFMDVAVSRGADRRALAERSGIDLADLEERDNRIAFDKYVALVRAGQQLCSDPALALHFGESVDVSEITFTSQIGAPSMTEALLVMNRYAALTVEVDEGASPRYVMSHMGGELWLVDTRKNANEFPELTESSFARMICSMRRLHGERYLKAVYVTHEAPSYRDEYDRIFGVPVIFSSDKNAFLIDDAILSFKPPTTPPYASSVLSTKAEELLEKLERSKSTRAKVERLLVPALKTGNMSMDNVASELGLSRQTLFRKLKAENVTFETVLDEIRQKLARHYLDGGRMSIRQTANLVGFSAFSRAFKRWTGSSPRDYYRTRRV